MKQAAKKIVIADDTLPLRVMLEDLLADAGYEVETVSDGLAAWELIYSQINDIDLLVLDLLMPRMSGFEVLAKLKEQFPQRKFPVLVVSGVFKSEKDILRLKELGANGYLNKTSVVDEILYRVNSFFYDVDAKQRRHPRVLSNLSVDYLLDGNKYSSYTTNLSQDGCFIRTLKPAPEGFKLKLWISVPDREERIFIESKVAWINSFDEMHRSNTLPGMGVNFESLDEKQQETVKEIIAKKLREENLWKSV